jgi:hypothetical protein
VIAPVSRSAAVTGLTFCTGAKSGSGGSKPRRVKRTQRLTLTAIVPADVLTCDFISPA